MIVTMWTWIWIFQLQLTMSTGTSYRLDPNVLELETVSQWTDEVMNDHSPILILFYHPGCGHCQRFHPMYSQLAAYLATTAVWGLSDNQSSRQPSSSYLMLRVASVNCSPDLASYRLCQQERLWDIPRLFLYHLDHHSEYQNPRREISITTDSISNMVVALEQAYELVWGPSPRSGLKTDVHVLEWKSNTGTGTTPIPELESQKNSTRPSIHIITRPKDESTFHDRLVAAAAVITSHFELVFHTSDPEEYLSPAQLDGLKHWTFVLSRHFPGSHYRQELRRLYQSLIILATDDDRLTQQRWQALVKTWRRDSRAHLGLAQLHQDALIPGDPDLFLRDGAHYLASLDIPESRPVWWLLHILTVNPHDPDRTHGLTREERGASSVRLYLTLRQFIAQFMRCAECRMHFLAHQSLEYVEALARAEHPTQALMLRLYEAHRDVNIRLGYHDTLAWNHTREASESDILETLMSYYDYQEIIPQSWSSPANVEEDRLSNDATTAEVRLWLILMFPLMII